jgi:hypothetical protein
MVCHMPTNETDAVNAALRRYHAMVERNPTALAWRAIAIRLWSAAYALTGDDLEFVRARANDAHYRADFAQRTGDSGRRRPN